jgi:hypothetical protein
MAIAKQTRLLVRLYNLSLSKATTAAPDILTTQVGDKTRNLSVRFCLSQSLSLSPPRRPTTDREGDIYTLGSPHPPAKGMTPSLKKEGPCGVAAGGRLVAGRRRLWVDAAGKKEGNKSNRN